MAKPPGDYWEPDSWNAVCSMCGRKRKAFELVRNWQGLWRCPSHNEPRHPQDFVRGEADTQTVPWSQPPTDIDTYFCTINSRTAFPDWAYPDCALPDAITPFDPNAPV